MNKNSLNDEKKAFYLYGAGQYGKAALKFLGHNRVKCFFDQDEKKCGSRIEGIHVLNKRELYNVRRDETIVLTLHPIHIEDVKKELENEGFVNILGFEELKQILVSNRRNEGIDYRIVYNKSITWINNHSIEGQGIICNTSNPKSYPEVTGYFIPTLLKWGHKDLAINYAKWLCEIQKTDGSWYDVEDEKPYIFDSGQIIRGLLSVRNVLPDVDQHIIKGCDWIYSNMNAEGRLYNKESCDFGDGKTFHEVIHLYCLPQLIEAADVFGIQRYKNAALGILEYYKSHCMDKISEFDLLSHFYAYVIEALVDLGETELAVRAMEKIRQIQSKNGYIPAYQGKKWTCSTGLFQLALVWYKLKEKELGDSLFEFACSLQNASGGWFGSYRVKTEDMDNPTYFPNAEISWATKYYLDALYFRNAIHNQTL